MKQYEAMFLFDSTFASTYSNVEQELDRIMQRAEAEIVFQKKWDERKLAYEIKKQKRGCYVLVFFKANPDNIVGIERDCKLADHILRIMILDAEDITKEHMENLPIPATSEQRSDRDFGDDRPRSPRPSSSPDAATATVEAPAESATATAEPEESKKEESDEEKSE